MKKCIRILAVTVLLTLCMAGAAADQYTYIQTNISGSRTGYLNADIAISGDGTRGSLFYVNSDGNGELVLEQTKGECYSWDYTKIISGVIGSAEEWGKYEIEVNDLDAHTYRTYQWDKTYYNDSFTVPLEKSGRYYIYVRPYSQSEMTASYTVTQFDSWNTPPRWWIKTRKNCTVSTEYTPSASEAAEMASKAAGNGASAVNNTVQKSTQDTSTATVVIQYITDDGKYNLSETQTLQAGTHTIKSKKMDGYTLRSDATPGSVTVTVKNGVADPSNIIFLFKKEEIPVQQSVTGTVQVYYQAIDGSWSATGTSMEYYPGTHIVYSGYDTYQYNGVTYRLIAGQSPTTVTVYENGSVSMSPIVFYFEREQSSASSSANRAKRPGEHISFGSYPQTASGRDDTPMQWIVLDVKGENVLLISEKILDGIKYHNYSGNVTWANCSLRDWLNSEFYYRAFSDYERQFICTTWHDNAEDTVFILDPDEARSINLVDNYAWRKGIATEYAKSTGMYYENGSSASWWLRTSRSTDSIPWAYASGSNVKDSGEPANGTSSKGGARNGVRPVIWVNMQALR